MPNKRGVLINGGGGGGVSTLVHNVYMATYVESSNLNNIWLTPVSQKRGSIKIIVLKTCGH